MGVEKKELEEKRWERHDGSGVVVEVTVVVVIWWWDNGGGCGWKKWW